MSATNDGDRARADEPREEGRADGWEAADPLAAHAVAPSVEERARLAAILGPLPEEGVGLLARYERLHDDDCGPGFAGALLAVEIRRRFPAETAVLDAARSARREAADAADPSRPLRRALLRLRHTFAGEAAEAEQAWRKKAERVAEIDSVLAALGRR